MTSTLIAKTNEVADALVERGVPVVFVTGYDRPNIHERYRDAPLCLKPVDGLKIVEALSRVLRR